MDRLKEELLSICREMDRKGLVYASGGNVSLRIDGEKILITPHGVSLGHIESDDILVVDKNGKKIEGRGEPSIELKLHLDIYKELSDVMAIIHSHPPYSIALTAAGVVPKGVDFESALFLGKLTIIPQTKPTMTDTLPIINALMLNNIVLLKNHGAVAVGRDLKEALFLTEILEESSKIYSIGRLFGRLSFPLKERKRRRGRYRLFSEGHLKELVNILNGDKLLKGMEDISIGIRAEERVFIFRFKSGRIELDRSSKGADFMFEAPDFYWLNIFNQKMNIFTAVIQGKVRFEGDFNRLIILYPQFLRIFDLWQQIGVYK